jgi:hypothetical protein
MFATLHVMYPPGGTFVSPVDMTNGPNPGVTAIRIASSLSARDVSLARGA